MDAPTPPGSPPRGGEIRKRTEEEKERQEVGETTAVVYAHRRFYLSPESRRAFQRSNTMEENMERIAIWNKQIKDGQFTIYGFLMARLMSVSGSLPYGAHETYLKRVEINGGLQVARLLAEYGHWFAAHYLALKPMGSGLLGQLLSAEALLKQHVSTLRATHSVTYPPGNQRDPFVLLAKKTKGAIIGVEYVRKHIHPVQELRDPPRLLRWNFDRDKDTGERFLTFDAAINITLNGFLVYSWGGFFPPLRDTSVAGKETASGKKAEMWGVAKLVGLYGTGFQEGALAAANGFIRINQDFMRDVLKQGDPGPGLIDLTDQLDKTMLEGLERGPKRRRRMTRYSYGLHRDAAEDARLAQRMAAHTAPLFWRVTVLDELRRDEFAMEELGYVAVADTPRGILLEPRNARGWTLSTAQSDRGVVLTIGAQALVGLGYYTLDDPIIAMKIEEEYERWQDKELARYQDEEDMSDEEEALELIASIWRDYHNDIEWVASRFNVAYFVFYDNVPYEAYLNSIMRITYWDTEGRRHEVPYAKADLDAIAEAMGE